MIHAKSAHVYEPELETMRQADADRRLARRERSRASSSFDLTGSAREPVATEMNRRYLPMLVLLALIWGSSFMFIKIAVRELDPATLVFGRLGVAALVLGVVVLVRDRPSRRRERICARTGSR